MKHREVQLLLTRMRNRHRHGLPVYCWLIALLTVLTVGGCDAVEVDPFANENKHFSIYGYLDTHEDEHYVRVVPVRKTGGRPDAPDDDKAQIDATVTTTDLFTDRTVRWEHDLVRYDDGTYGHVYRAPFSLVQRGHKYRLHVVRSNGDTTWADTYVPNPDSRLQRTEPRYYPEDRAPDDDTPPPDSIVQTVNMRFVPRVDSLAVVYCPKPSGALKCTNVAVDYSRRGHATDEGWQFDVHLLRDQEIVRETLRDSLNLPPDANLQLPEISLRAVVLSENWTHLPSLDPDEQFAQPDTSIVHNGFGFWGSRTYFQSSSWEPSDSLRQALGY